MLPLFLKGKVMTDTLTREKMTQNIQQILWGKSFVDVMDGNGDEHTFILRSLSIKESNHINYMYNRELLNAQREGILTLEQLKNLFEEQEVWTKADEDKREELILKKKMIENQIRDAQFSTVRKKNLKKALNKTEEEISEINSTEMSLFFMTAEQRSEEIKRRHMVRMFTEDMSEEPFWETEQDFMQSRDFDLSTNLILAYYKYNMYDEKDMRQIARSTEWRFRWTASKNGENLFGRPISEWTEAQNFVVYWSEFYDSIYESYEKPADWIIEDDSACDAWVRDQNKKSGSGSGGTSEDKNVYGHKRATKKLDHAEQFIMVKRGDEQAVKKVQDMNTESTRQKLQVENEQIDKVKDGGRRIKEWDLGGRRKSTPTKFTRKV